MEDKTLEELQAELDSLKKTNLEAEIAFEKGKAEEKQRLEKEKEMENLRNDIRKEVEDELKAQSKIDEGKPEKLDAPHSDLQEFQETFAKKHNMSGKKYEEYIHDLVFKGYKK